MLFSSTIFLYVFLPIVLAIYYGLCKKEETRNFVLLVASLFFYAWGEPKFVCIMILSILVNYGFGLLVDKYKTKAKLYLVLMVIFNLTIMGIFKYLVFIVQNINAFTTLELTVPQIVLPIGISFFTFQSISYVVDVYRGHGQVLKNPLDVGLYIAFFPQLIAGPIVRYETVAQEIHGRRETEKDFAEGIMRFILGLSKKVLLSNQFALIADKAYALESAGSLTVGFAWLGAISYMLQIYFDFGGYSDMAIGLGKMFGFHFNENFNYPYIAKSISDFWRRWHISLSTWFRDYVYIPLGGNRVSKLKHVRNILIVWTLTGIWHGANWTFIAWGFFFGIILLIEKFTGLGAFMNKTKVLGHLYAIGIVLISWILFRANSLSEAVSYIGHLFSQGDIPMTSDLTQLYFNENLTILIIGIIACLPVKKFVLNLLSKYKTNRKVQVVMQSGTVILLGLLFFTSVSYLVKGTYNPFIYFNF